MGVSCSLVALASFHSANSPTQLISRPMAQQSNQLKSCPKIVTTGSPEWAWIYPRVQSSPPIRRWWASGIAHEEGGLSGSLMKERLKLFLNLQISPPSSSPATSASYALNLKKFLISPWLACFFLSSRSFTVPFCCYYPHWATSPDDTLLFLLHALCPI